MESIRQLLQSSAVPDRLAASLNQVITLPRELPITFQDSPSVNAWYAPQSHSITVSYRLARVLRQRLDDNATVGAMNFILMHELGHALIGELDLPQVGNEENAADEFATLVCAQALGEEGRRMALAGSKAFWELGSGQYKLAELPFYDEHSLERQRFYTILANLGAADPSLRTELAPLVPYTRLAEAQQSYALKVEHWERLLAAHQKGAVRPNLLPVPKGSGKLHIQGAAPLEIARLAGIFERSFALPRDLTLEIRQSRAQFLPLSGYLVFPSAVSAEDFLWIFCQAMIHDLRLPYTGELEDAAVELSALLIAQDPNLRPLARPCLAHFQELAKNHHSVLDVAYWSATAQPEQRYFQLLGYLYWQDPAAFPEAITQIPPKRLKSLRSEYPRKLRNWGRILAPYKGTAAKIFF